MKDCAVLIKEYIEDIKKSRQWDIIIYDRYNLLCTDNELNLPEIRKWHKNPYCLAIKKNRGLQRRCVYLKNKYQAEMKNDGEIHKVTCYAGVTEISLPVFIENTLFSIVSVTGIKGSLREKTASLLSGRLKTDIPSLHNDSLLHITDDEEASLKTFLKVLSALLKEHITTSPHYENAISALFARENMSPYVFDAIDYIKEHFTEDITLAGIADHCHLSASYLQHLFIKVKGIGISEEIRECRLERAAELLRDTNHSVRYIALDSGFNNVDYFSTAFKKRFGKTPLKFRNKRNP
ncbi:MAG: helix-turn-helix transcriptional regulator [Clostridia bacterium]|nr:helix-turn-helix transcriptional regulator [Clostridia bacterium]